MGTMHQQQEEQMQQQEEMSGPNYVLVSPQPPLPPLVEELRARQRQQDVEDKLGRFFGFDFGMDPSLLRAVRLVVAPFPPLAVLLFVCWGYNRVIFNFALPLLQDFSSSASPAALVGDESLLRGFLLLFHALLSGLLISWMRCVFSAPKKLVLEDKQGSYCEKCHSFRPQRAHHCQLCRRCVERMDHHCPFLFNCVGKHNYKFFLLLVMYACLLMALIASYFIYALYMEYVEVREVAVPLGIACFGTFSTGSFSLFHLALVLFNFTTIELIGKFTRYSPVNAGNPWDVGYLGNFCEVFGKSKWKWFLPIN